MSRYCPITTFILFAVFVFGTSDESLECDQLQVSKDPKKQGIKQGGLCLLQRHLLHGSSQLAVLHEVADDSTHGVLPVGNTTNGAIQAINATVTNISFSGHAVAPVKSKITLLIIQMVPFAGPLGVDRFYLGGAGDILAWVKLSVCICTCFLGGLVWHCVDSIVVIVNALKKESDIDAIGMKASFNPAENETAYTLGMVALALHIIFCFIGPLFSGKRTD